MNTTSDHTQKTRRRPWMAAWLERFRETGNATLAAQAAGVARETAYLFRADNPNHPFVAEWERAAEEAIDRLEAEALRRGKEGVGEPVYYKGEVVGEIKRYSDTLLIFLLKALRPDKYRDNYHVAMDARIQATVVVETETDRAIREDLRALAQNPGALAELASAAEGDRPTEPETQ